MMRLLCAFLLLLVPVGASAAPLTSYDITITDGVFDPPVLEVPAKERFKIKVANTGKGPAEFENLALRVEKVLGPGVKSFVVIHPLRPGNYSFIDEFHMDMEPLKVVVK